MPARRRGPRSDTSRRTNLGLLVLLAVAFVTGALAFAAGTRAGGLVVAAHGAAGLGLLALAPWKQLIVRRGLRRRRAGKPASVALIGLVVAAVAAGVAHAAGVARLPGGLTAMQVHVGAALAAAPLAAWHVRARPVRPRRTDLSRRALLRAGALSGGAALTWGGLEGALAAAGLPGARRRFTGSHETGSRDPAAMPVTQWIADRVPAVDPGSWRLRLAAGHRVAELGYEQVTAFDDRLRAVLDCTGGWWAVQDWAGVRLDRLLPHTGDARSVVVTSVTGYRRRLPVADLASLLLATRAGGRPLSAGHGFPARLVAPGRRGFWWVKWVTSIELDPAPWWLQPPFPTR
ncbi:MAG TPA: molybdopterin-dependent oxidoreductase [Egibacteraceae bacterium]|nr:molybdopterin-dependent oxidoreductase [Egibacteraceae bacterium]